MRARTSIWGEGEREAALGEHVAGAEVAGMDAQRVRETEVGGNGEGGAERAGVSGDARELERPAHADGGRRIRSESARDTREAREDGPVGGVDDGAGEDDLPAALVPDDRTGDAAVLEDGPDGVAGVEQADAGLEEHVFEPELDGVRIEGHRVAGGGERGGLGEPRLEEGRRGVEGGARQPGAQEGGRLVAEVGARLGEDDGATGARRREGDGAAAVRAAEDQQVGGGLHRKRTAADREGGLRVQHDPRHTGSCTG